MNAIIRQLKAARQAKKLTQSELGAKLGLPQSHISKIEKEVVDPRLSTVLDMARLLDQEFILAPKALLPIIQNMIRGDAAADQQPRWQPDEDDE